MFIYFKVHYTQDVRATDLSAAAAAAVVHTLSDISVNIIFSPLRRRRRVSPRSTRRARHQTNQTHCADVVVVDGACLPQTQTFAISRVSRTVSDRFAAAYGRGRFAGPRIRLTARFRTGVDRSSTRKLPRKKTARRQARRRSLVRTAVAIKVFRNPTRRRARTPCS